MSDEITHNFAIVSLEEGFHFSERKFVEKFNHWSWFTKCNDGVIREFGETAIVAKYQNPVHCKQQLAKAQELEKQLRPMWQAALEHAMRLENYMLEQVYAIARDNEIK